MDNTNELFGDFTTLPNVPPPPSRQSSVNQTFIVDNNTLYKKMLDIETEINNIKALLSNMQPILYPQPRTSPKSQPLLKLDIPSPSHKSNVLINSNSVWKGSQTQPNTI